MKNDPNEWNLNNGYGDTDRLSTPQIQDRDGVENPMGIGPPKSDLIIRNGEILYRAQGKYEEALEIFNQLLFESIPSK